MNSQEAWQEQQKIIEYYKDKNPELLQHKENWPETKIFSEIGIWNIPKNRLLGYFRLFPQDFIVEEKNKGRAIKVNQLNNKRIINRDKKKINLYAHLIKIGIPTNVAIQRIADCLNLNINKIGYAGFKDADAITAQLVVFSQSELSIEEISKKNIPNVFLTNFYYDSGSLNEGDLEANIFTITLRTKEEINRGELSAKLEVLEKYGILNYFQSQRFGGIRLISHKLGKIILQGNYELAVRYFLFKSNEYDIPLIINLRKKAEKLYPDWQKIKKIFEQFPYTFFNEIKVVGYLIDNPDNFIGALIEIKDQTKLWIYAYTSWLFNKYLSEYAKTKGCISENFPILLSSNSADNKIYYKSLKEDKILNFAKNLRPFKFIQLKQRFIKGRIFPKDINYEIFNKGVVINFTLPKGSYATTFLINLFELYQGLPIPEWVNTKEIDPKEMLGQGSIKEIKEIFKDYWYSKLED